MPKINKEIIITNSEEIDYKCDNCNIGYMRQTGIMLPSCPPKYPHKCTFCNDVQNLDQIYPKVQLTIKKK